LAGAYLMTASTLPDRERALQLYKRLAAHYDRSLGIRLAGPVRHRAVRALALGPGQTVQPNEVYADGSCR